MENSIMKKNNRVIAVSKMQEHALQTLRKEHRKVQTRLQQDIKSLTIAEIWALEAEEEKARIMLELEEMKSLEECENSSFTLLTTYNSAVTERARIAEEKLKEMQCLFSKRKESVIPKIQKENHNINDDKRKGSNTSTGNSNSESSDEKSKEKYNVEFSTNSQELQETVKELLAVHKSLLILNARMINIANDMDKIESVVTNLKNDPNWIPTLLEANSEVESWRISLLQKAYDDVSQLLQQARDDLTLSIAAELVSKVKYLCIINNIFSCHPVVLASAVMDNRRKWQDVHHVLPAVKRAMFFLRRKKK
ncbi:hypothetical protein LSM04_006180 [Trypanosoma melophagium]|nr:hypothetical protein LSM04_006180 [Trypanosoma melophagium]